MGEIGNFPFEQLSEVVQTPGGEYQQLSMCVSRAGVMMKATSLKNYLSRVCDHPY